MRWFLGSANSSPAIRAATTWPSCFSAAFSASLGSAGRFPFASTLRAACSLRSFAICTSYIAASTGSVGMGCFPSATRWIVPRSGNTCSACSGVMFSVGKSARRRSSAGSLIASGFSCCSNHLSAPIASTRSTSPGRGPKVNRSSNCSARSRSVSGTSGAALGAAAFCAPVLAFAAAAFLEELCAPGFCRTIGARRTALRLRARSDVAATEPSARKTTRTMRMAGLSLSLDRKPTGLVARQTSSSFERDGLQPVRKRHKIRGALAPENVDKCAFSLRARIYPCHKSHRISRALAPEGMPNTCSEIP